MPCLMRSPVQLTSVNVRAMIAKMRTCSPDRPPSKRETAVDGKGECAIVASSAVRF